MRDLPSWIRKKQLPKDCYRMQFPLDLSRNITCHRAQGQTLAGSLVSVNLGLENPDARLRPEIGSIVYVACTRVNRLDHLFVSSIFPEHWKKIGKSDLDNHRRKVEETLRKSALKFAESKEMYAEVNAELTWTPDYSDNGREWSELQDHPEPPMSLRDTPSICSQELCEDDYIVAINDIRFPMFLNPVLSERHIGLDQGTKNFGMVVVERAQNDFPRIVAAENYTNLDLVDRFLVTDVVIALTTRTDLMEWMQPVHQLSTVDRVIVHLEQIDRKNRNWKQFSINLGRLLQQQAPDAGKCIVKLSSPHIHRATGPIFRLGNQIIEKLQLRPELYLPASSRSESKRALSENIPDVEPSSDDDAGEAESNRRVSSEYRHKKKMSADIFRYNDISVVPR
jgi:hypothetical protein